MKNRYKIMAKNGTFLLPLLETEKLLHFIGIIKHENQLDRKVSSNYYSQIRTTRLLILKNSNVTAAPIFSRLSEIHIVISNKYVHDGSFFDYIKKFDLVLSGPSPLTSKTLNECINFTITCRLAPNWNKVDKYFVNSFNFLTSSQSFLGISFETCITDRYLAVTAKACKLSLPLTTVEDLGVSMKFLKNRGVISVYKEIYLLPQLIPGTLINISMDLPDSAPFATYTDIRNYWKDVYGYYLPVLSETTVYAQVFLNRYGPPYSYPLCCTRLCKIVEEENENCERLVHDFLKALARNCPLIAPMEVEMKLLKQGISKLTQLSATADEENDVVYKESGVLESGRSRANEDVQTNISSGKKRDSDDQKPPGIKNTRSISPPPFFPRTTIRLVPRQTGTVDNNKFVPIFSSNQKTPGSLSHPAVEEVAAGPTGDSAGDEPEIKKNKKYEFDIEILARVKCLQRATIAQLTQFCKDKGIHIKSKMKKEDLKLKIYEFYGISINP